MTNVFVLTTARPTDRPFDYLEQLLFDIDAEELPDECQKVILVDGTPDELEELRELVRDLHREGRKWECILFEKPAGATLGGNKLAYWRLLELALERGEDALLLEDDLVSCANATTRAILFPIPSDVDIVQVYSGFSIKHPHTEAGLWRSPALFAGCQAVKYPLRTLRKLVAWARLDEWNKYTASDQAIGLARSRLGLRLAHHVPDLYQHAGFESAVDAGMVIEGGITDELSVAAMKDSVTDRRSSATWPGRTFDAMRLFARHEAFK
jgi:hypothetical protein